MPVVSDETLWQLLQSGQFTTPLLREWIPWVCEEMRKREIIVELNQSGCRAGLMQADNEVLDKLASRGVKKGYLPINGQPVACSHINGATWPGEITTLDDYLLTFGSQLGQQAERSLEPLHVPGEHSLPALELLRSPFEAQSHVVEATRKALQRQKSILLVGEMGVGKSVMALAAIHAHADGRPYRALVFCPGQLVNKWEREIRETIPGAAVIQIESWKNLLPLEGFGWSNATAFNERYGRIETRITERSGGRSEDNRMSRGSRTTTIKMVRPGIMPPLFGRHLNHKGGCLCQPAREGQLRCSLIVRPTSEDVVTGNLFTVLKVLNPPRRLESKQG